LSPLEHTERLLQTLVANWIDARLNGKPIASARWYVESSGRIVKTAYPE
jgi:hypothetical protein